jgi:long-chain acyl-CoA synthetase
MTLPQMLAAHARRYGDRKVALREKEYGIWQEVSWAAYAAHVRAVGLGLEALGLRRGETLAIVCGNRPAWLYAELGAQALGAIPVGVYVDSLPEQACYVVAHCEAKIVVVEDQEQADKILAVRAQLPRRGSPGATTSCSLAARPTTSRCSPTPPAPRARRRRPC